MSAVHVNDKLLYSRLKNKDKDAFIKAYDAYLEHIYRFIFFKVSSHEQAEDLTAQTFLKIWDHIQNNQLRDYKTLKGLLYRVARNLVIDHYRKKSREQEISIERSEGFSEPVEEKQDILQQIQLETELAGIYQKMNELKDEYREAIILRYVNELSITEIAETLDKSKGNVRVIIFRALTALKELSQDEAEPEAKK